MPPLRVLFVDPSADTVVTTIRQVLKGVAEVDPCADFVGAKSRLLAARPDVLITNLRLRSYNGLHLVLFAATSATKSLVFAENHDVVLAREAQRLGAFYERASRLPFSLPAFISATVPDRDRRDVAMTDRRMVFRGGRRVTDTSRLFVTSAGSS